MRSVPEGRPGSLRPAACRKKPRATPVLVLVASLIILPGIVGAEIVYPIPDPCPGTTNIVVDGGFEAEAPAYAPLECPCPLVSPWGMEGQWKKGGATVQRGGTEGAFASVVSLDDSGIGEWILISQNVSGGRYCNLSFTSSLELSGGRTSDLIVYLDWRQIWYSHETVQGRHSQPFPVILNVSSFSGNHTLRFQQRAFKAGIGKAAWVIDDIRLMAGPPGSQLLEPDPAIPRPEGTNSPPYGVEMGRTPVTGPGITEQPAFQPLQFLSCLARRIHDEFFSFIPLRGEVSPADPGCA
jgi:hypothetical protein